MKVLVTAASRHGSTAAVAEAIASALALEGIEADVVAPDEVTSVQGYDGVVLGSAVYIGKWLDAAKGLVARFGPDLARRPVWLFSSGPIGDPPKPEGEPVDVAPIRTAIGARDHRVFSGELDRSRLGLGEKLITRAVGAREGDYRDWSAMRDWAREIARTLGETPVVTSS